MTNEDIKNSLLSLEKTETDFSVIMTGKESRKVNGMYKPETHEILIHNKNFKSDNQMIYTAIHEYAHHLVTERRLAAGLPIKNRCHDTEFWAKMDDLVEKAVGKGIYTRSHSDSVSALIRKAKELDAQIAKLQGELGEILAKIQKQSKEDGGRFEDIAMHELKMKDATVKKCCQMTSPHSAGLGQDEAEAVSKGRTAEAQEKMRESLDSGKTVNQTKRDAEQRKMSRPEERLIKEHQRIQKTITALQQRLDAIEDILEQIASDAA